MSRLAIHVCYGKGGGLGGAAAKRGGESILDGKWGLVRSMFTLSGGQNTRERARAVTVLHIPADITRQVRYAVYTILHIFRPAC